jgi:large subunit ribosomal protein L19e
MNLEKKKLLASRALNIGKNRILFNKERLLDIKEAITKQDIKDLLNDKAIYIKEIKGRKAKAKRKTRRRVGSKRKVFRNKKRDYVMLTRKLRKYAAGLMREGKLSVEKYKKVRKEIKAKSFRDKSHLKEHISQ